MAGSRGYTHTDNTGTTSKEENNKHMLCIQHKWPHILLTKRTSLINLMSPSIRFVFVGKKILNNINLISPYCKSYYFKKIFICRWVSSMTELKKSTAKKL